MNPVYLQHSLNTAEHQWHTGSATLENLCQTPWKSPELLLLATDPPKWTWIKPFPPRLSKAHMPWKDTKNVRTQGHLTSYIQQKTFQPIPKPPLRDPQSRGASPHHCYSLYTIAMHQLALCFVPSTHKATVYNIASPQYSQKSFQFLFMGWL